MVFRHDHGCADDAHVGCHPRRPQAELVAALEAVSGKYSEIRFLVARLLYLHFTVWMRIGLP